MAGMFSSTYVNIFYLAGEVHTQETTTLNVWSNHQIGAANNIPPFNNQESKAQSEKKDRYAFNISQDYQSGWVHASCHREYEVIP